MLRARLLASMAVVVVAAVLPAVASADPATDILNDVAHKPAVDIMPEPGGAPSLQTNTAPTDTPGAQLGVMTATTMPATAIKPAPGAASPPAISAMPQHPKLRLTTKCVRRHTSKRSKRWQCITRNQVTRSKLATCSGRTKARTRKHCIAVATRRSAKARGDAAVAHSASLDSQGYTAQTMAPVGRLIIDYPGSYGRCSATVVSPTLLLTAGHCISPDAQGNAPTAVLFLPGATWTAAEDPLSYNAPYGMWVASHWWAPGGWNTGKDAGLDWALIEIPPTSTGTHVADVTGSWAVQPQITFRAGAHIYMVGYPAGGYWSTSAGHLGRGQYFCDTTWGGSWQYLTPNSNWELWESCTMNRGASGGPWFVQFNDGHWALGGLNNRCKSPWDTATDWCAPYSYYMRSTYLDSRFYTFWNSVQGLLTYH
jgi:hypothetical protein